jgi:DNA-directed RNA polymerase specialized sigma24 family protein
MTPADSRADRKKFNRLLLALDRDRNRASVIYESIRIRLSKLFSCNGFPEAYDLIDETFRRVERKLDEGLRIENVAAYSAGIARKICLEAEKEGRNLGDVDDIVSEFNAEQQELLERTSNCLERCLNSLPERDQRLILDFYTYSEDKKASSEDKKASSRRRLADSLGLSDVALRVAAHRLRTKIEPCVRDCLRGGSG